MRIFKVIDAREGNQVCISRERRENVIMIVLQTIINGIRVEGTKAFGTEDERDQYFDDIGYKNDAHLVFMEDCLKAIHLAKRRGEIPLNSGLPEKRLTNLEKKIFGSRKN